MSLHTHTFSIDTLINSETSRPFGSTYAGEFTVRRPTIADEESIALLDAANLSRMGNVEPGLLSEGVVNRSYIFAYLSVVGTKLPTWFDKSKLFEEDKGAVYAVWLEVSQWLKTFRPKADPAQGSGTGGNPAVLVPQAL